MARVARLAALLVLLGNLIACGGILGPMVSEVDGPEALDVESFEALVLTFRDPDTATVYRVGGPYRVLRSMPEALELEGFGRDYYETTELLLFLRDDELWARARIEDREFVAQLPSALQRRE